MNNFTLLEGETLEKGVLQHLLINVLEKMHASVLSKPMMNKCTPPCSCQVETCNTQAGVWNPQGAPPDLTVRSHCKDSSCHVIIGWISQRQAPGLLLLLLPVVGWGWQRKSPGVARGKSHQHSRETWNFLVFNPLSNCPLRADQSSTAPLPSFSGYLEYWFMAGKVGKLLKVCRT